MTKDIQGVPEGHVVVTWDQDHTRILAVTRQDDDGRILSVIAEVPAPKVQPKGTAETRLYHAAINCPHTIERDRIVLEFDPKQPGHNALNQLGRRLDAAAQAPAPVAELRERIEELEADVDRISAERDEALRGPWQEWATNILKMVREVSGYDGYDDDDDGVDLAEEVRELIAELTSQIKRLSDSRAPAVGADDAKDAARFRWLIDERNWNENEDSPSVCTSEDVHWGNKARALIDRHMETQPPVADKKEQP